MNFNLPILADGEQAAGGLGGLFGGNMWMMILLYAAIIGAIYFFLIRPNSKKKKEEAQMRNNLEIGDEITTIGGIMGRIVAIKDDEDAIIIETGSDRVKMKLRRSPLTRQRKRASLSLEKKIKTNKQNKKSSPEYNLSDHIQGCFYVR